jgi:hypothetical protein
MPIAVILETLPQEGQDARETYDQLTRELNNGEPMTRTSDWGDGLISHTYCVGDDGGSIGIDVWQDEASWNRWFEKLSSAAERTGGVSQMPQVRVLEVHNLVTER